MHTGAAVLARDAVGPACEQLAAASRDGPVTSMMQMSTNAVIFVAMPMTTLIALLQVVLASKETLGVRRKALSHGNVSKPK